MLQLAEITQKEKAMNGSFYLSLSNASTGVGVTNGFFAFISTNSSAISVLIGVSSLLITLVSFLWGNILSTRKQELEREKLKMEILRMQFEMEVRKQEETK